MTRTTRAPGATDNTNYWRPGPDRAVVVACPNGLHRGPHNRCAHPTPPPAGTRPCEGDPACPFRLPARLGITRCPEHAREERLTVDDLRAEQALAMGLSTAEIGRMEFGFRTPARAA